MGYAVLSRFFFGVFGFDSLVRVFVVFVWRFKFIDWEGPQWVFMSHHSASHLSHILFTTILISSFATSRATLYHRHFTHPALFMTSRLRFPVFHAHFTHLIPLILIFFLVLSVLPQPIYRPPLDSSLHWCLGIGSSLGLGSVFVSGLRSLSRSISPHPHHFSLSSRHHHA